MEFSEYIQMPYYCDDCHTWHITLYDEDEEGIWEGDLDGNWDISMGEVMPDDKEVIDAWNDYAHWVVNYGEDPLGEFGRDEIKKTNEKWTFKVFNSPAGPIAISGRKSGGIVIDNPNEFPKHVQDYLYLDVNDLSKTVTVGDTKSIEELISIINLPDSVKPWPQNNNRIQNYYLLACVIERSKTISPSKTEIRRAAKLHLNHAEGRLNA